MENFILYNAPQSTCSQRVRYALHAKKTNKNFANSNNKEGSVTFLTPEKGPFINLNKYKEKNYLKDWKVISTSINSREVVDNNYFDNHPYSKHDQHHQNILCKQ